MSLKASNMIIKLTYIMFFCGLLILLLCFVCKEIFFINDDSVRNETRSRVLSRSKRFLVFPAGSSLQLVFCVQTSALIPIGDIFLYGNTAALAWNLPTEAKDLLMFKEDKNTPRKRSDEEIFFTQIPQKRSAIVNPAFAKRSVDENMTFKEKLKIKIDRAKMHERKLKRDFLNKQHLDHDSVEFHRNSRVELYEKLVPLITALGGDGRQCVLYKLCESARFSRQGTFLEEFLRVVFTLPKGREFQDNAYREYDSAHTEADDCATLYPGCDFYLPMQTLNKYRK